MRVIMKIVHSAVKIKQNLLNQILLVFNFYIKIIVKIVGIAHIEKKKFMSIFVRKTRHI